MPSLSRILILGFAAALGSAVAWGEHWAFQPIAELPKGATVDTLIGESPPPADRRTLIRRLYFDLIGLPPKAGDLDAGDEIVDQLLASPQFGERWARHWLDVVRYSETKGHVTDIERPHSWKYRDYVIDAFNGDLPYDRFVKEHVAGDLLDRRPALGETNIAPTATGALFFHEMHFMSVDPLKQRWDEIDAQIDIVSKSFLGLTVSCARCHDHKTDPVSQRDYYAMAGYFLSTELGKARSSPRAKIDDPALAKAEAAYEKYIEGKRKDRVRAQTAKNKTDYFPISDELGIQSPADYKKLVGLMREVQKRDPSWASWVRSAVEAKPADAPLLVRGEAHQPAEPVPRRFPTVFGGAAPPPDAGSGRLQLAEQIAGHPLTARVWANRIWQHLMGEGIVATPNDFGVGGAAPSNPALLDYLAAKLIASGWSTKTLVREIVRSDAYHATRERPRRLEAEAIRDAVLTVCGTIDLTVGGDSVPNYVPPYATANKPGNIPASGPLDGNNRRSIYIKVRRNFLDPFLSAFDFPDPGSSVGQRTVTETATQALAMMNSPFVHEQVGRWGGRVAAAEGEFDDKVGSMFVAALSREPGADERALLASVANGYPAGSAEAYAAVGHVLLKLAEFRFVE